MYKLIFSKYINTDFTETINYIKNTLKAPKAAETFVLEIKKKLNHIKDSPLSHALVKDEYLSGLGIRIVMIKNYILFYSVNEKEKTIYVYRFLYGKRDWISILNNKK